MMIKEKDLIAMIFETVKVNQPNKWTPSNFYKINSLLIVTMQNSQGFEPLPIAQCSKIDIKEEYPQVGKL